MELLNNRVIDTTKDVLSFIGSRALGGGWKELAETAAASQGGDIIRVDFGRYEQPENPEAA